MTELDRNNDVDSPVEYSITGKDIFRVVIATLLILGAGFVLVSVIGYFELMQDGSTEPDLEKLTEWSEGGVSSLPNSFKFLALLIQSSLILPVILFLRNKKLNIKKHLRLHMVPPTLLAYSILVGVGVAVLGDELSRLMNLIVPLPEEMVANMTRMLQINSFVDLITMGLTVAVVAPLIEEMLFRGFFQRFFEASRGVTTGVLTTSALFAFYHFNMYWVIPILIMSTIIGAMAWRTESIYPSVVVHGVNNTAGLIAANIFTVEPSWYSMGDHVSPFVIIITLGLMVWALKKFFDMSERKGLGGHGPRGDVGVRVNKTI